MNFRTLKADLKTFLYKDAATVYAMKGAVEMREKTFSKNCQNFTPAREESILFSCTDCPVEYFSKDQLEKHKLSKHSLRAQYKKDENEMKI